ncbi:aspartyl aminopeptidase [Brachybacterium muris]|uniref:M18 family aminopeptidase n=1 Tax=Brachybacterium muris UCD-AY4 TaxID=1249481 RepID=A0A022KXT2_9MICO|nr:M18 family aminopeptidase [Brachybacterium muris]EYT49453.1 aminopeptidase 2 [Brachybacterium muris UCD-AY4]MBM7501956.1 aspartyl aminopeptidase [Brachybacterium muris]MCT1654945.1 M18 family aminopeptidase [Brachybacterium muris]MCT2178543.1 M18 family aminopeptidase [Brachybacterium muris]MCT2296428.1 M18 family aminopeptidase [Brachybacterium muris]
MTPTARRSSAPARPTRSSASRPSPEARAVALDLGAFVTASPSSYHAAREAARRLEEAGFTALDETLDWTAEDVAGEKYVIRDGAIIAWSAPKQASATSTWRIVGSHTDSPALKLKPNPEYGGEGLSQVGVEIYGGPLLNSWLDRELRLAGQLALRGGSTVLVDTPPLLRVPQLAVHLDRGVNAEGLKLDPQRHLQPILGIGPVDVLEILAEHASEAAGRDIVAEEIVGFDVVTVDAQAPALFGAHEEFLASARLDNLSSMHAEVQALITVAGSSRGADAPIAMMVANDHEEVGSATRSGAGGPFLEDVLVRLHEALGGTDATRRRAFSGSLVLSADAGHAAHPNYPERHDPVTRPRLGAGPMLKINAQQRYATDAVGIAAFAQACEEAGVPHQHFVSSNAMPCGSTIGPITATRLGITTIDVGITLLSMHSAREMCATEDPILLQRACAAFLRG